PIDADSFPNQIAEFLLGKHDTLSDAEPHLQAYQAELVKRLEGKVRELTTVIERNKYLNKQNKHIIALLQRRQHLLEAAARVGHSITSILNLDKLLNDTVDIICEEYDFYYAGIFLLDPTREWATLRAGRGPAGDAMIAEGHKLAIGGDSMIGRAIAKRQARIALDVGEEAAHFKNPYLPHTRSEMALPLIFKNNALGALSVQSEEVNAFSDDDIAALQALADQVAIAISNANLLRDLEAANKEILRTKTYEAIATATGEAIHWVGNKAAPIPGSVHRVREDLSDMLAMVQTLLKTHTDGVSRHSFWSSLQTSFETAAEQGIDLTALAANLIQMPPRRLQFAGGLESILEDLDIIDQSAATILNIKEDLIGPARQQNVAPIVLPDLLQNTIASMGLPEGVVSTRFAPNLPSVHGDEKQIDRVFINLIKNAWEALHEHPSPRIEVIATPAGKEGFVCVHVRDNGPGIPPEIMDKIWVSFFTTKGERGGTGLGLAACMEIINQSGGKIWVESPPGQGAVFTVLLPK
ncbi:MAG: ATP-binding protein, partial [Anaerolineales bacterium]